MNDYQWDPKIIARTKDQIAQEFGPQPISQGLWRDEPYGWVDQPQSDQDIIYDKLLYDWEGGAHKPLVRVPDTEWLIHYTTGDFTRFNRARRIQDNIKNNQFAGGHSSYMINLDCDKPLSDIAFGFQFAWSLSHMIYDKFYPNTIWRRKLHLFRSSAAVQHLGDNGEVVFRACSEQDMFSFTFDGRINGEDHEGVWVSDATGDRMETPWDMFQWADAQVGITREWPLPVPGQFTSIADIKTWAERMGKCSWSAHLNRGLRRGGDLAKLETMSEREAVHSFNETYRAVF